MKFSFDVNAVLDDLERRRDSINEMIFRLRDLAGMDPGPQARLKPAPEQPAVLPHKKPASAHEVGPVPYDCEKHPDNTEFTPRGKCRKCQKEQQAKHVRDWYERKKAAKPKNAERAPKSAAVDRPYSEEPEPEATAPVRTPEPLPSDKAREFVYSKPLRCGKCGLSTRFKRIKDADPARDYWVCVASRCTHKIAHVMVKPDNGYQPEAAA